MRFENGILITDPCYVKKRKEMKNWTKTSTVYGDWSCTTYVVPGGLTEDELAKYEYYLSHTEDRVFSEISKLLLIELGKFCADAGEVGIFDLEELHRVEPEFFKNYGTWTYTSIPMFKGNAEFKRTSYDGMVCVRVEAREDDGTIYFTRQTGL
jgi:hypothetical protein